MESRVYRIGNVIGCVRLYMKAAGTAEITEAVNGVEKRFTVEVKDEREDW